MDLGQCTDPQLLVDPSIYHREILLSCLNVMAGRLKRNICKLDDHVFLSEVKDLSTSRVTYIGDALGYACHFWTKHLVMITSSSPDFEEVHKTIEKFFTSHFLFWIEVLSIMGNLDAGVYTINDINQDLPRLECEQGKSRWGGFETRVSLFSVISETTRVAREAREMIARGNKTPESECECGTISMNENNKGRRRGRREQRRHMGQTNETMRAHGPNGL